MSGGKLNFFMEDIDYPREELHKSLDEILSQRSFVIVPQILKALESGIRDGVVLLPNADRSFVRVLLKLDQMDTVIRWAVKEELVHATKREIFRENTLASHLIVWTFRLAGEEFLADSVRDVVQDLCNSTESLEIDPSQLEASGDVSKNIKGLTNWTIKFMDRLLASLKKFPPFLRNIVSILEELILERFKDEPDRKDIFRNVLTNFLILRYVSLAIVSPAEYDLIRPTMLKTAKQKRNLVLVAKMITSIAYGNHFRSSFEVMNQFVDTQSPRIRSALDNLSVMEDCKVCMDDLSTRVRQYSDSMEEDVAIIIKYFQLMNVDKIVVESLNVFYKHIIEQTGVYSIPEMMEMLTCFSKLKWIVRTDWFSDKNLKNLKFPKAVQRILQYMGTRDRAFSTEFVPMVRNEKSSLTEWFDEQYPKNRYTIYVFYRGFFCTGCKKWLAEWNDLLDIIHKTGGKIYGITAESAAATKATTQKWKLKYDIISDPDTILAERHNVAVEDSAAAGWTLLGDYGPKFSQPAIVCLNQEGSVVYFWKQQPNAANIFGGTGRAVPIEALESILESVDFAGSSEESYEFTGSKSVSETESTTSDQTKSSKSSSQFSATEDVASAIRSMDKLEIHKLVNSVVKEDAIAVNLYDEVMKVKKSIKESEKRIKKEQKLQKKNSSAKLNS